jgi:hypothetical protein
MSTFIFVKKFLVAILSIIYLTTTTGFTLNMHYCMGKLVDLEQRANTGKCSNCGMDKSVAKIKAAVQMSISRLN